MRYAYFRSARYNAMKAELESYRINIELKKLYTQILTSEKLKGVDVSYFSKDLKRVNENILFVQERCSKLAKDEQNFLYDVYMDKDNMSILDIMKKYSLKKSSFHRKLQKAIFVFSALDE